ncbi:MAG: hypothetical protein ABIV63_16030 [Caldimonas sp.]
MTTRRQNAARGGGRDRTDRIGLRRQGLAAAVGLAALLVLSACGSNPPQPDWQANARTGMDRALAAYLVGNSRIETLEFATARAEVARTGRPALLARVELVRCAGRVASLVLEPCAGFDALAQDAEPAERVYADFIAGRIAPDAATRLPEQHRALAAAGATPASDLATLRRMTDPLARLVGAAVSLQLGRADPGVVALAVETASAQGWRRPLLAWLQVQSRQALDAGDVAGADRIKRRIELVQGVPVVRAVRDAGASAA